MSIIESMDDNKLPSMQQPYHWSHID